MSGHCDSGVGEELLLRQERSRRQAAMAMLLGPSNQGGREGAGMDFCHVSCCIHEERVLYNCLVHLSCVHNKHVYFYIVLSWRLPRGP